MKHLFLGIALLLAAAAAAQTQPRETRPVMRMGDPDLYLELKPRTAPPARPAPVAQPPRKFDIDKPSADEKGLQSEYLLQLAAPEACSPDVYVEELEYMYMHKGETPLTVAQLEYLIRTRRSREHASEK